MVDAMTWRNLFGAWRGFLHSEIDIEGMDRGGATPFASHREPAYYLSMETTFGRETVLPSHYRCFRGAGRSRLYRFRIVDQQRVPRRLRRCAPVRCVRRHTFASAVKRPFGEEAPGDWLTRGWL